MKIYFKLILLLIIGFSYSNASSQSAHKLLRKGDKAYLNGDFQKAEQIYSSANEKNGGFASSFNLGNSQYQQKNYADATKSYQNALGSTTTSTDKANIYYNLGNAAYEQKQYQQAVNAYKKALKYNPSDLASKENIILAKHALRQQQKQENKDKKDPQDQKNKEDQQQENNKEQENKDSQDQKNKEQQQKDQQNKEDQDQNKPKDDPSKEKQKANGNEMSKKEAKELLDVIENEEKKVHQKLRRVDGKAIKPKKDW